MQEIIIESGRSEKNYWRDLWRYRELFYILSWRDLKVRYKQTVIGVAWSVVRPLVTMIILTFVFGNVAKMPNETAAPYAILVFAALLPWQFFANSLAEASNSLVGNANLITKVYFPRLIIPASSVIVSLVDFLISLGLMVLVMIWYQFVPSWKMVFLPLFLGWAFFTSFGVSLFLTALNVKYRDFRYIVPFIVQFGLYVSPVGFSSSTVAEEWRFLYGLNPMVGIIEAFRWGILGDTPLTMSALLSSAVITIFFTILGIRYFRSTEKSFADNI